MPAESARPERHTPGRLFSTVLWVAVLVSLATLPLLSELRDYSAFWVSRALELCLYALVAVLVAIEPRLLADYNFDKLAGLLLAVTGLFLALPSKSGDSVWISVGFVVCSALVVNGLRKGWGHLPAVGRRGLLWLGVGALFGAGLAFTTTYLRYLVSKPTPTMPPSPIDLILVLLLGFGGNLVGALVIEEALFRGFLWGHLSKRGATDGIILMTQTVLFAIAHLYLILNGSVAWFSPLAAGLLFGILTWRSRSIGPSILAHSVYNALLIPLAWLILRSMM